MTSEEYNSAFEAGYEKARQEIYKSAFEAGYNKARQEMLDSAYMGIVKDIESDKKHRVIGNMVHEITPYGLKLIGYIG